MTNILIVEDQWLLASAVEDAVEALGFNTVGPATNSQEAFALADRAEVALIDVNLVDGATGAEIGRKLAEDGVTVVFVTANPEQLGDGVSGALGVIAKPLMDLELIETINYAAERHAGRQSVAPRRFMSFPKRNIGATQNDTSVL